MAEKDARAIVAEYVERVWHLGDNSAVSELVTDPYVRHDPGGATKTLSRAEQLERVTVERAVATAEDGRSLHFEAVVLSGDEQNVTWVWNMTAPAGTKLEQVGVPMEVVDGEIRMCGIEIFRVVDGRITEVWNSPPMAGHWG